MSRPDIWIVISNDKPGSQHVAGAFRSYDDAKHARLQLARPDRDHTFRSMWQYEIWQLPLDKCIDPPTWP